MADNEAIVRLTGMLNKSSSQKQINSDIRELEKAVSAIRLTAILAKGESRQQLNQLVEELENQLAQIKLKAKIDKKNLKTDIENTLNNLSFKEIETGISEGKTKLKIQKIIADTKKTVQRTPAFLDVDLKENTLKNQLNTLQSEAEATMNGTQGKSTNMLKGLIIGINKIGSAFGVAGLAVNNFQKSLKTIQKNDLILTNISKTSNSAKSEMEELGNSAFDTASKFGLLSSDYLTAVQEFNKHGFYGETGKSLGELSLKAQAAGSLNAEAAQNYLLAANSAYRYEGSAKKLSSVLDGQNAIANNHNTNMETMAAATEKAGFAAANAGIKINELSAMVGTISAATGEEGSAIGTGITSLLEALQNVSSDKIVSTLQKAGASMTETANGADKLRNPIAILKDLAKTYNTLDENNPLKNEITTNIGQEYSEQFLALLKGWNTYEKMLTEYSQGIGSSETGIQETTNSLNGKLNILQNSWDSLVNSITNKSAVKGGISFLDGLLNSAEKLIDIFNVLPVALAGVTAAVTAKNKDVGITKIFDTKNKKLDIEGNLFGIDFTQIKHFKEASSAIEKWNNKLHTGKEDISKFKGEIVQNNTHLREYLKTCSVDAPGSLKGYKSYLKAAGESTNSLRLSTILLNTAISFGLGVAIQGAVSLITGMVQRTDALRNTAAELGSSFNTTSSDIDSYKEKITELQATINDSGSSIEDVTNARKELMGIQTELINKYGTETDKVNAITEAINGQVSALEKLKKSEWYDTKSDYNVKSTDDHIIDFVTKTIPYVFEKVMLLGDDGRMELQKTNLQDTLDEWESQSFSLKTTGNKNLDKLLSESLSIPVIDGKFELNGSVDSLYKKLSAIKQIVSNYQVSPDFQESLASVSDDVQSIYESNFNIRNQSILYDKILSDNPANLYDEAYDNLGSLKTKYDKAVLEGNKKEADSAIQSYAEVLSESMQLAMEQGDFDVARYFENMYPELQQAVGEWNFSLDFETNSNALEDKIKNSLKVLKDFSKEDFEQFNANTATEEQITAYSELNQIAGHYNISFNHLLDLLQNKGLVQEEAYINLTEKYGENNISKLTPDELEIAYTIRNTGNMSFDEFRNAIQTAKEEAEKAKLVSFDEAWNALDTTDDASLQNLKADLLSLAKQGKLTVEEFNKTTGAKSWLNQIGISAEEAIDKINNLKEVSSADQLASMKTGISSISNILGEKKENLSDTKTANTGIGLDTLGSMPDDIKSCVKEYESFCEVLGNGSSTMAQCKKAANKLANAYINSNNFLSQLTEENGDYYISILQEMGIENADIIVTDILRQKKAELNAEKQWAEVTTLSLANATYDEITALANEQQWSDETKNALYRLALQKQTLNGISLNSVSDIDNLIALVDAIGGTSTALSALREIMEHPSSVSTNEKAETYRKAKEEVEDAKNRALNALVNAPKIPENPTNTVPSPNKNKKDNLQQIKESKQEIDWLSRMLTILQNKIDILKEKFENLFSVSKKSRNLHSQIKETEKLLNVQEKATARYQKKADSYYKKNKKMLSKNNVNLEMLKNGSYNIKSYKSGIANIIQTFEEYYDKAQESRKATLELTAAIRELSKQKLELKLDDNERKRTYWEAKYANAATVNAKNNIISKEIKTYASDNKAYNQYYSRAKKLRKKESKEAKTAVSKTKGLSKTVKNKIKDKIKQGKEIPSTLLEKVKKKNEDTYDKLVDYNNSLDFTADALRDKKLSDEEYKTNRREAKIEKHQNRIDAAEAKYNLSQQRETNATDAKTKNKYEAESLKYLEIQYKHLIEIAKLEGDVTEQKRLQAEKQEKIAESYKKMYDNIKTEYENQTSLNDAQIATVQAQIATLEASGKSATKEIYNDMMKISSDTTQKLLKERAELEKAGKNFEYASDEWYNWQNDLLSIDQQLESSTQQLIEFQKAINELDLKKFSLIAAQLESANNQIDFLTSMLSHKDLTSQGAAGLTDEGLTTISLWMDKMENNKKIIENAQNAMAEYQKQMAEGTTGDNFETQNQTLQEFIKTIQDAALADEDLKDSIINLVEEAFNVQLDVLSELIEKRKKALQTEKNLYDYQRKVASQTKTIASIQKQIAALAGDHSEEARAKLQKLKVNLEEAQQDLKDTEYDKWLSDQEDMLDSMAEEMENFFDNALQNTDSLISAATKAVNENGAVIVDTLKELGYGDAHSFDTKDNGNGTFTSYYTDYNGNQIQITSDQYGNVVKDTAKPDPFASAIESAQNFRDSAERNPQTISWNPLSAAVGKGHMADRTNASIVENKNVDNSSVILQRRDSILTPEQTEQFKNFLGITPPANGMAEKMAKMTQPPTVSSTINKPRNVNVGGVTIHLDGSRIIDEQSFVDTLKHSTMIQSAIDESVAKGVTKTYSNTLGRF